MQFTYAKTFHTQQRTTVDKPYNTILKTKPQQNDDTASLALKHDLTLE